MSSEQFSSSTASPKLKTTSAELIKNNDTTEEYNFDSCASDSSSDTFTNHSMHLLTNEDFNSSVLENVTVNNEALKMMRVAKMSHGARHLFRNFGDSPFAAEIIFFANQICKTRPSTIILPLPSLHHTFPNTSKNGLFATRHISMGEFIIAPFPAYISTPKECGRNQMGLVWKDNILFNGFQSDFINFQVVETPNAPSTSRKRKRPASSISYEEKRKKLNMGTTPHSDDENGNFMAYDKYDVCVLLNESTEQVKAIRRNCSANLVLRYVLLDQRMEFFICARKDIKAGEELTLTHDYDANFSPKVIQCTHPFDPYDVCLFEKERQKTMRQCVQRAQRLVARDDREDHVSNPPSTTPPSQ